MITSGKEYMPLVDVSFLSALNLILSANKGSASTKLFFTHEATSSYLIPISFNTVSSCFANFSRIGSRHASLSTNSLLNFKLK